MVCTIYGKHMCQDELPFSVRNGFNIYLRVSPEGQLHYRTKADIFIRRLTFLNEEMWYSVTDSLINKKFTSLMNNSRDFSISFSQYIFT